MLSTGTQTETEPGEPGDGNAHPDGNHLAAAEEHSDGTNLMIKEQLADGYLPRSITDAAAAVMGPTVVSGGAAENAEVTRHMGMEEFIKLTRVLCDHRWLGEHDKVSIHTGTLMASLDTCYVIQKHEGGHNAKNDTVFRLSELHDTIASMGAGEHHREAVHQALEAKLQQQVGAQALHEALTCIAKKGAIDYHKDIVTVLAGG